MRNVKILEATDPGAWWSCAGSLCEKETSKRDIEIHTYYIHIGPGNGGKSKQSRPSNLVPTRRALAAVL
jgi:hypothetical protein